MNLHMQVNIELVLVLERQSEIPRSRETTSKTFDYHCIMYRTLEIFFFFYVVDVFTGTLG